jgi:hypothetical protein
VDKKERVTVGVGALLDPVEIDDNRERHAS